MNELEQNRIRRIENQVNALTVHLRLTTEALSELYELIADSYDPASPKAEALIKKAVSIQHRAEALRSLTPRT